MEMEFAPVIKSAFKLKKNEGQNKVISLEEAIKQNVKPGMTIYLEEGANAAARAILRQFWGSSPTSAVSKLGRGSPERKVDTTFFELSFAEETQSRYL